MESIAQRLFGSPRTWELTRSSCRPAHRWTAWSAADGRRQRGGHGGQCPAGRADEGARWARASGLASASTPVCGRRKACRRADGLALVKERLLYLRLRDRSARGAGRPQRASRSGHRRSEGVVRIWSGSRIRPLAMTLDTTGVVNAPGDLFTAIDAFETVVQPAYGDQLHRLLEDASDPVGRGHAGARRDADRRDAAEGGATTSGQKIVAAIPKQAVRGAEEARGSCS